MEYAFLDNKTVEVTTKDFRIIDADNGHEKEKTIKVARKTV